MSKKGFRFQVAGFGCFVFRKCHQMLLCLLIARILCGCAAFPQTDSGSHALMGTESESAGNFSPIQLFRKYISPIDGNRCPMYPSCSAYSMEAIQKHGLVKGWIMTCDRLLRCGRDELKHAPRVIIDGEVYCHDPVSENNFLFEKPRLSRE